MVNFIRKNKVLIILLAVFFLAGFLRFWKLSSVPPGLYPDVAINGNDAMNSLQNKDLKIFYPENNGREGLFMWLIAFSFWLFKTSIWSLKIPGAAIGTLTVLGLYLLTKELFKNTKYKEKEAGHIALISSFFLAVSFWHLNFSRIGFRAILTPFVLVFGLWFLFRGFNNRKISDFIFAGVFLGLGFYTYISFRITAVLFLIIILWWFLRNVKEKKEVAFSKKAVILFLIISFIISLPIGIYFLKNPHDFLGRAAGVSVFSEKNAVFAFLKSLALHLAMFNFRGDNNWRHNFSGNPQLSWPVGLLFLIGLIIIVVKTLNLIKKSPSQESIIFRNYCFLMFWFGFGILPGVLTAEGIPHALRTIAVIPAVYIFAGLGAWEMYKFLEKNISKNKPNQKLFFIAIFFLILTTAFIEPYQYFNKWAKKQEVKNGFSENYLKIGNYLNSLPDETQKYIVVNRSGVPVPFPNGLPMPAQTIMFIEKTKYGKTRAIYLEPKNLDQIKINNQKTIILPMGYEKEFLEELFQKIPGGKFKPRAGTLIYEIN